MYYKMASKGGGTSSERRINTLLEREKKGRKMACSAESDGLPEGCIADILSLTTPPDACRLSLVSKIFRSAAESDAVWERFLPSDYQFILARSDGSFASIIPLKKKQLFFHLCDNPLLIDGGMKSFSLDKWTGKKCYMIAARDLTITWGSTPDYWGWISLSNSRFTEVAQLLDVCWLEIRGKIITSMLSPETTYMAYLVCNFTNAEGFNNNPADASVGIIGGENYGRTVYLNANANQTWQDEQFQQDQYPLERGDGWLEIQLGEYFIEGGEVGELDMSLKDSSSHWKSGLIIQGIEVRPKRGFYI